MCTCVKDKSYAIAKAYNGSKILNQITQVEKSCQGIAAASVYCVLTFSDKKWDYFDIWYSTNIRTTCFLIRALTFTDKKNIRFPGKFVSINLMKP